MKLDLDKVVARLQDKIGLIHATLLAEEKVTANIHRVVVSFNSDDCSQDQRYLAIAKLFDNEARPIENSFREIAGKRLSTAVGFIAKNNESKQYTEEMASSGKYKTVASNCLIDTDDESLWEVTANGDNKFLVRKSQEDLSTLVALASAKSQAAKFQKTEISSIIQTAMTGEYAAFVDVASESVKFGYVLADLNDFDGEQDEPELEIMERDSCEPLSVNAKLIIESALLDGQDDDNLPETETASNYDSTSKESMKEYYKQVYAYAPEYYAQLEKIIDQHAVV